MTASARGGEALLEQLAAAAAGHPRIAEARAEARAVHAVHEAQDGFFDPRLIGAAGVARDERSLPGVSRDTPSFANAAGVQAGVEWALRPGFYVGVGLAERQLLDPPADADRLYQRTAGVRLRIPVLRDRGFLEWREGRSAAQAGIEEARGILRQAEQDVYRDVALRLIDWLHAGARQQVASAAADRVRQLQEEAEELVRLEMQPAYQILPARLEVALRLEELAEAEQSVSNARRRLTELVGSVPLPQAAPDDLLAWIDEIDPPDPLPEPPPLDQVGRFRAVMGRVFGAEAARRLAANRERSSLSVEAGITWQGDGESGFARDRGLLTERAAAGEAALVWRRSLGARTERGEREAAQARLEARLEEQEALAIEIAALAEVAHRGWTSAGTRLEWVRAAARDASAALAAEEERFRLGEGASRQVLEAQKDLTAVLRRQVDIAAELLRERARFRHAVGYAGTMGLAYGEETP